MEMRRKAQPTTPWERVKFVLLWRHGMSLRTIARHTGSSVTTVYRWIRRWQQEGHINTRPRLYSALEWDHQVMFQRGGKFNENVFTAHKSELKGLVQVSNKKLNNRLEETSLDTRRKFITPMLYYTKHNFLKHVPLDLKQKIANCRAMSITLYPSHSQTTVVSLTNKHFH